MESASPTNVVATAFDPPEPTVSTLDPSPSLQHPGSIKLPRMHYLAYRGDVQGVLQCIIEGLSVHEAVSLRNQHGRLVSGITPLFLAAQRGHFEVAKLLVDNGSNSAMPSFIQGSTELCTPAQVASLNFHFKLSRYLKKATKHRRQEEKVLAFDDEDRISVVSSRLARGMERASSLRNAGVAGTAGSLARMSRASGGMSVTGSMLNGSVADAGMEAHQAANEYVQHMDLATFDPEAGAQPPLVHKSSFSLGKTFSKLFSKKDNAYAISQSQRMRVPGPPVDPDAGSRAMQKLDLDSVNSHQPDHSKILGRFLKDLDLATWDPDSEGPGLAGAATHGKAPGTAGSLRATSPGRGVGTVRS